MEAGRSAAERFKEKSGKQKIRVFLTAALLIGFLYQLFVSVDKYWNPVIVTINQQEQVTDMVFPSKERLICF